MGAFSPPYQCILTDWKLSGITHLKVVVGKLFSFEIEAMYLAMFENLEMCIQRNVFPKVEKKIEATKIELEFATRSVLSGGGTWPCLATFWKCFSFREWMKNFFYLVGILWKEERHLKEGRVPFKQSFFLSFFQNKPFPEWRQTVKQDLSHAWWKDWSWDL